MRTRAPPSPCQPGDNSHGAEGTRLRGLSQARLDVAIKDAVCRLGGKAEAGGGEPTGGAALARRRGAACRMHHLLLLLHHHHLLLTPSTRRMHPSTPPSTLPLSTARRLSSGNRGGGASDRRGGRAARVHRRRHGGRRRCSRTRAPPSTFSVASTLRVSEHVLGAGRLRPRHLPRAQRGRVAAAACDARGLAPPEPSPSLSL